MRGYFDFWGGDMYINNFVWWRKTQFVVAVAAMVTGIALPAQAQFMQTTPATEAGSAVLPTDTFIPATAPAYQPLWFDAQNKVLPLAQQAVQMLLDAEQEGLNPQDYEAASWQQKLQIVHQQPLSDTDAHAIDKGLTSAVVQYLNHLNQGRIDPKTIREKYEPDARPPFDAASVLQQAIASGDIQQAQQAAMPKVPMYAQLRQQLQHYLSLRSHPAWQEPLPALPRKRVIRKGQKWSGLPIVVDRLVAMGDMTPPDTPALVEPATQEPIELKLTDDEPAALDAVKSEAANHIVEQAAPQKTQVIFDDALQAGITAFQKRHKLRANGRLNRATVKKLNRSPQHIADHIAQTMERLRWTPLQHPNRMIVVNVPEFRLRAYSLNDTGAVQHVLPINVIVGKKGRNKTPLFSKNMIRIEFSPYWNVPSSILRREMMSRISADPSYLSRNNYEVVGRGGVTRTTTPEVVEALRTGKARVRQRPGRGNAMGGIKFVFPNRNNIYLHYTASPRLFKRSYRALSHGCIRVQDPVDLAHYILQNQTDWTKDRIQKMMRRGKMRVVRLDEPLPVVLTYLTAFIHETGKLHFVPDVYGQDVRLRKALAVQ